MSPPSGVSPSASSTIDAAAPPSHETLSSTLASHSTAPTLEQVSANRNSSLDPSSSRPSRPSSTSSSKVHIPRLSAATTALLAQVSGAFRGEQQDKRNISTDINTSPATQELHNPKPERSRNMRASSAFIDLPTPPFVYSHHMVPPALPQNVKPGSLVPLAPKPGPPSIKSQPIESQPVAQAPAASPNTTSMHVEAPQQPQPILPAAATFPTSLTQQKKAPVPRPPKNSTNGSKRPRKRKRGGDDDGEVIRADDSSSAESDITPVATQTKSGRQVNRPSLYAPTPPSPARASTHHAINNIHTSTRKPKRVARRGKETIITCVHCQRGHSPTTNNIVFCDQCNRAFHQLCHDPPIEAEVVTVQEKEWLCRECKPVPIAITQPTVVRSKPRSQPLGPPVHAPLEIPQTEVGGEGFSAQERRGFLSALSHAALVELLVTISNNNPTVPMFPDSMKAFRSSNFSYLPKTPTNATSTTTTTLHNNNSVHPLSNSSEVNQASGFAIPDSRTQQGPNVESSDESEYEIEEHRLYPRAGNGFLLSRNANDMDIMREDSSCPTFSHSLHGPAQARAPIVGPVWGKV